VYVAKRESTQQLRLFSAVGRRLPAHPTALGKALLAPLREDELEAHLPDELVALSCSAPTMRFGADRRAHIAPLRS
jgi:DNA-binding IclR family transcriptional regulator